MFTKDDLNQLYHYALSLSRNDDNAYDLVQYAVERYLQKSSVSFSVKKPLAYVKTIIRNRFIDLERHKKVLPMISIDNDDIDYIEPIDDESMEDVLINQQQVQQLIGDLNSEENELLYLWAVEEHTVEEIAAIFEKPKGTILSKLHRLKKRIREQHKNADFQSNLVNTGKK